ncbi:MAG: hypothetical protein KC731_13115 [Myxococcales bacterium]|nr:hypothetical protein [Myxococcales bacterium]
MPYRLRAEPCSQCDLEAGAAVAMGPVTRCRRCESALCLEHVPVAEACCLHCEARYHDERAALPLAWLRGAGFAAALPLFGYLVGPLQGAWRERMWVWGALPTGLAMVEAAVMTVVLGLLAGEAVVQLAVSRHRRRFLGEHHEAPPRPRLVFPRRS